MEEKWYYDSDPYLGEITLWAGTYAPIGWQLCHGQLLSIAEYDALFSVIGTTYGGDGMNTFALPDLRGRVPIGFMTGPGLSDRALGDTGGAETVSLQSLPIPVQEPPLEGPAVVAGEEVASIDHLPPFLALNFIMAVEGVYPTRP
ncbi:MAG: phage tail protein [Candidatus Hydrogenedentota bacterium]